MFFRRRARSFRKTHGSAASPSSPRRHDETPGFVCPGPMSRSQARHGAGDDTLLRPRRTPRWRTLFMAAAAAARGGGREGGLEVGGCVVVWCEML